MTVFRGETCMTLPVKKKTCMTFYALLFRSLVSQLAHKLSHFANIVLNNLAVHGLVIRRTLLFDPPL